MMKRIGLQIAVMILGVILLMGIAFAAKWIGGLGNVNGDGTEATETVGKSEETVDTAPGHETEANMETEEPAETEEPTETDEPPQETADEMIEPTKQETAKPEIPPTPQPPKNTEPPATQPPATKPSETTDPGSSDVVEGEIGIEDSEF